MILKEIKVPVVENLVTNTYIICDKCEAMIIDPAGESEKISELLKELNVKLKYILLTHCHIDHVKATIDVKNKNRIGNA